MSDQCDCRVWRKALAPLMKTTHAVVVSARASAPIGGVRMKRVPSALVAELHDAWYEAEKMWPRPVQGVEP